MDTIAMFDYNYECDIYQPEDFTTIDSTQEAFFFICLFSETPMLRHQNLIVLQQHLLRGCVNCSTLLSSHLSALNVPYHAHPSIIQKITDYARAAANEDNNMDFEIIPLVVTIKVAVSYNINEESSAIAEAVARSINGQVVNLVPASKSSIEALKKIKVEGCSKQCVVCLEEMEVGSEAAAMPCLHIYHQYCIVNWLKNSNLCPLCRFQMS